MRRTKRSSLFWLVALLLLWQQMAVATSLCSMSGRAIAAVVTPASQPACMQSMQSMQGGQGHVQWAVCTEHCAQGRLAQSDTRSLNVPGSMLPPLAPVMPNVIMLPRAESLFASAFRRQADHPPIRLLFCSLLI